MKYYSFNDQISDHPLVFSEENILADYWGYWRNLMEKIKERNPDQDFGPFTKEECIKDWIINTWAWESTPEEVEKYHNPRINALTMLGDW